MTATVDVHQAKTHLSELLDRAHAGEEIILAKAGKPHAVLGPLPSPGVGRRPGRLAGQTVGPEILLRLPTGELDAWDGRHERTDDWDDLAGWWFTEADDPAYREEVGPLFLEVFRPRSGQVVLDLGCGDGRIGETVATQGVRVVGVDINLELARMAAGRHPVFLKRLPDLACVRDEAVDGAYAVLALEHLEDSACFFAETARVTRVGGSLAIVLNHPVYTAPGSGPVIDPTDGELFWRFGGYLGTGRTREPAGDRSVEFIHRPVGTLLTQAASAGWSLEEVLEQGVGTRSAARDPILAKHRDIPHLMALRWQRR